MKKIFTILTILTALCAVSCEELGNEIFNPNGKPDTGEETPGVVKPAANEIWYTNGSTTDATAPYKTNVFGANIISNTYDSEKECWVIKFDSDVTSIGNYAFRDCNSLTSVTIPNSVTSIGDAAFYQCSSLTSVNIPESVTEIGESAFIRCSSLTTITIPNSVTSIRDYAFGGCSSLSEFRGNFASEDGRCLIVDGVLHSFAPAGLTEYTIPNSVTEISNNAFRDCSSLTSVTIGESVTSIGQNAFSKCSSLTSVTIGENVTEIGNEAFFDCTNLREFRGKFASEDGRCLIVDGVLNLFAPAGLTEYTIPNSVTSIGKGAFQNCTSLTSVTIPNSVTEIGAFAFQQCSSLTSVKIGENVTSIGEFAFWNCRSLTSVYCEATTPPTVGNNIFDTPTSGRKIYVPAASVEAYKTAEGWSRYASDIVGYNFEKGEDFTEPAANEIWYTNGSTTEATTPYKTNVFGANIISNTYDSEKECWVIEFDGDVTSIELEAFAYCHSLTSINIPDGVTSIGYSAFADCRNLTSVTIPNSVTSINEYAFYACNSLSEIRGEFASEDGRCLIVDGVLKLFASADLTEYAIPNSVTEIGEYAFYYCGYLTSITIPNSVTSINEYAFYCCRSLTSINIPDGVTSIGYSAFADCRNLTSITIPNSVTEIGSRAFLGCRSLTSINIPDGVTSIGVYAFRNCSSLTSIYCKATTPPSIFSNDFDNNVSGRKIYVPASSVKAYKTAEGWSGYVSDIVGYDFEKGEIVPDIEAAKIWYTNGSTTDATAPYNTNVFGSDIISNAYYSEKESWAIEFDEYITSIGEEAFRDCHNLTSIIIPDSITAIGNYAFANCHSLTSVNIPNCVTAIGNYAFYICGSLTSITIPNSVTSIGEWAFCDCRSLTSITISDSISAIGDFTFAGCNNLTSINIPNCVTAIGEWAFMNCWNLTSITIPNSVTEIEKQAFMNCLSLTSVYCKATTPPAIVSNVFDNNASGRKIYVPAASVEAYKTAEGWSGYASDIVGYNF